MTQGRMTYHLRRLRLHGLIRRIPHSHRYEVTDFGLRTALFFTRAHDRILRTGLALVHDDAQADHVLRRQFAKLRSAMNDFVADTRMAS